MATHPKKSQFYKQDVSYEMGSVRVMLKARIPKEPLVLEGLTMQDIVGAAPGVSIGCAISNSCNRAAQRLPFKIVAPPRVTARTIVFPTKLDKLTGFPCECIKYSHGYRHITDANDRGTLKKMAEENPRIIGRPLTFFPAPEVDEHKSRGTGKPRTGGSTRGKVARPHPRVHGSGLRALKAGLISKPILDDMTKRHPDLV